MLALLLVELWPVSGRVMMPAIGDPVPHNMELGRDHVVGFLEKAGPSRVEIHRQYFFRMGAIAWKEQRPTQ